MKSKLFPFVLWACTAVFLLGSPHAAAAHQVGEVVPFFRADDVSGQPVNLGEYLAMRRVVVFFWDWRRATSTREMSTLEQIYGRYRDHGLTILALEGEGSTSEQVADRLEKLRVIGLEPTYTIVPDPGGSIARQFRVNSTPQTFLLDGSGRIVYHLEDFHAGDEIALEDRVRVFVGVAPAPGAEAQPRAVTGESTVATPAPTLTPPDPRRARLDKYRYFGNYHLTRKEPAKAADYFRLYLEIDPTAVPIWLGIGEAHALMHEYEEAREAWETVLRLDPGNAEADANIRKLIRGDY